jgi:hypothetical protein
MARKTKQRRKSAMVDTHPQHPDRRRSLRQIATYLAGGAVLLGGGAVFALDVRDKLTEQDLSVIGQGTPVVLQIHDPQCSMCAALQKQTRLALKSFGSDDVLYRVANIRSDAGAAQQRKEGLPHVTLALYNGVGERVHVVQGVTEADELIDVFKQTLGLKIN